jgi:hypothetical protein
LKLLQLTLASHKFKIKPISYKIGPPGPILMSKYSKETAMAIGTIYKYSNKRTFSVIRPKEWKVALTDVVFKTTEYTGRLGDTVKYDVEYVSGKGYATNIVKVNT